MSFCGGGELDYPLVSRARAHCKYFDSTGIETVLFTQPKCTKIF